MKVPVSRQVVLTLVLAAASGSLGAQDTSPVGQNAPLPTADQRTYDDTPLYRIQVVARDIPAINYMHRKDSTTIGFQGTELMRDARGQANVHAENGRTVIDANFDHLIPANTFGPEYLTYVLWAITPEGRPMNLGEVLPGGKKGIDHISVTTGLQAFGLIVTAEPYFAVVIPSDVVVAQNFVVSGKTNGIIEPITAHYSLLPRGAYEQIAGRKQVLNPIKTDERTPLEVYEAENAVAIAEAGGADQYAADSINSAKLALQNAEGLNHHNSNRKETITYAREAVQSAEDARLITIRKLRDADQLAAENARRQAEQQAAQAQQAAEQQQKERDEAEKRAEEQAQKRAQADLSAQQAQQQADAAHQQQLIAEQQTAAARQAQRQAEQNAQQLAQQTEQARERLREQLSQVLQTRETARGLIMNLSDVLFGFNKYELKPDARVKLAKISGILLAYPDLKVQIAGYTDNVGSPEYNQKLSEERADNVRNFLVSQNVPANNVVSEGYGENNPVADNQSSSGRAQNRRVELVVSGASIGFQSGTQGSMNNGTGDGMGSPSHPAEMAPPAPDGPGPR